mgnify:CR=1 FL=1
MVFKWYRQPGDEEYVPQAVSVLEGHLRGDSEIHVPNLIFYELGNILLFKESLVSGEALTILKETFALALQIHPIDLILAEEAFKHAREHDITFYDASFVALSSLLHAPFITADRKLFKKVKFLPTALFLGSL